MKKLIALVLLISLGCSKDTITPKTDTSPIPNFSITIVASEGGSVDNSGGNYSKGTKITVTATPDGEYIFDKWSDGSTDNPREITINSNLNLTANFIKKKYSLTLNVDGEGTVSEEILVQGSVGEYNSGTKIRLTAIPSEGWEFGGWGGSIQSNINPIEIDINQAMSIDVVFTKSIFYFIQKAPNYPSVNNTIGNIRKNYYHPGIVLTPDLINEHISLKEGCDCTGCGCEVSYDLLVDTSIYFDYNADGRIDLFGFLENNSRGYRVGFGKYVLVSDIFNNPETTYFDSNVWVGGRMELNDFNGDGKDDVLVYHENDHGDGNGGYYSSRIPLEILYFNADGTFTTSQVGPSTGTHDLVSFDIDNDGDVDIVNDEWWYDDPEATSQVPLFYLNDGTGNFTTTRELFEQHSFYERLGLDFSFTGVDAFDLDNDGYVDLIIGNKSEDRFDYCTNDNPNDPNEQNCYEIDYSGIRVFWGSESHTFSESNSSRITLPSYQNGNSKLSYGFGFIDVDNDGYYEIVNVGTNIPRDGVSGPNSGGYVEVFANNGDRSFTSISSNIIDTYEWDYANKSSVDNGDIPLFYFVSVVDVDEDGDFDIIPHAINTGFIQQGEQENGQNGLEYVTNIGEGFHWRNDGGYFTLVEDRIQYQN